MSIVNFAIHKVLEKLIVSEEKRFDYLSDVLSKEIVKNYKGKRIPSVEEQLAEVL